jgi:hypothetical protein
MTSRLAAKPANAPATAPAVYPRRPTTVARAPRLAALALLFAACGGGADHRDSYVHATQAEQSCCEHLAGGARDQCLASLIKVDDPAVRSTSINEETFACVEDHFTCDASTGRATKESAQQQLDCIADLGQ